MGVTKYLVLISLTLLFMNVLNSLCERSTLNIDINNPVLLDSVKTVKKDMFGASIALSKNDVFIGAPKHAYGGGVFHCSAIDRQCSQIKGFENHGS